MYKAGDKFGVVLGLDCYSTRYCVAYNDGQGGDLCLRDTSKIKPYEDA